VSPLATKLNALYIHSFAEKNVRKIIQFAEIFSDIEIVAPVSWSHFI
jgi:DNA-dependent RNA polymerase auxiliary subunit epsilon